MYISKRRLMGFVAAMVALAIVAASWAYFTASSTLDNPLSTKKYGSRMVEEFNPGTEVDPGAEVDKKVNVMNTGDADLVVRIKMEETWKRGGNTLISFDSANSKFNTAAFNTTTRVATAVQVNATDGLVVGDDSVVYKNLAGIANWTLGADGYYYYKTVLGAGQSTNNLLESLIFANNMDVGVYDTFEYFSKTAKTVIQPLETAYATAVAGGNQATIATAFAALEAAYNWQLVTGANPMPTDGSVNYRKVETVLKSGFEGYADADYSLKITTEVCQATKDAVNATWTTTPTTVLAGWGMS